VGGAEGELVGWDVVGELVGSDVVRDAEGELLGNVVVGDTVGDAVSPQPAMKSTFVGVWPFPPLNNQLSPLPRPPLNASSGPKPYTKGGALAPSDTEPPVSAQSKATASSAPLSTATNGPFSLSNSPDGSALM
jgi:hypothetical protein